MLKKIAVAVAVASIAVTATVATATVAFAGSLARTGINGSKHDINAVPGYTDDSLKRTCVFCHTPHNVTVQDLAPLWNRAASASALPSYTWISPANSTIAFHPTDPLVGPSRLCMSCHDGVIAVDTHNGAAPMPGPGTVMAGAAKITSLATTHPIGFLYADAVAARGLTELVPATSGFIEAGIPTNGTFNTNTRVGLTLSAKTIGDTLYGGFMTCASCHDVHNTVNAVPDIPGAYNYFLNAKQEQSAICLSCHVK